MRAWRPEVNTQDLPYLLPYSETQPNEPAAHRLGWTGGATKLRAHHASASPVLAGVPWMGQNPQVHSAETQSHQSLHPR